MENNGARVTVRLQDPKVLEAYDRLSKETWLSRNHLLGLALRIALPHLQKRAKELTKLLD